MNVKNIYTDIRGEGFYIGELSVFVELTQNTEENTELDDLCVDIVEMCQEHKIDVVTITGYEPFEQKDELLELIELIPDRMKITIETSGAMEIPKELYNSSSLFLSIKPNLSQDKYDKKTLDENILAMNKADFWNVELKFSVDVPEEDIPGVSDLLRSTMLPEHTSIIFQPTPDSNILEKYKEISEYILDNNEFLKYDIRVLPSLTILTEEG